VPVRGKDALGVAQFGHGSLEEDHVARGGGLLGELVERGNHLGEIIGERRDIPFGHESGNFLVEGRVVGEVPAGFASVHNVFYLSCPIQSIGRTRRKLANYYARAASDSFDGMTKFTELSELGRLGEKNEWRKERYFHLSLNWQASG